MRLQAIRTIDVEEWAPGNYAGREARVMVSAVSYGNAVDMQEARRLRMTLFTWLTGSLAALSAYLPQSITGLLYSATLLMIVDTITGYAISKRRKNTTSFTMRQKLSAKCSQFLTILAMGVAAALIARVWTPIGVSFAAIIAIEFTSNLENLVWLEMNGGAPLGPARPMLMKLATALGLGPTEAEKIASKDKEKK